MRFLCNAYNPKRPDAKRYLELDKHDRFNPNAREEAWQRHLEWLSDKIIDRPEASEEFTVEQMEAIGLVGVYVADKSEGERA